MIPYLYTRTDTTGAWLMVVSLGGHELRWRPWAIHCLDYKPSL